MSELRQITIPNGINFTKIVDYRMREGIVPVACIDLKQLSVDGIAAYRMSAVATYRAVQQTFDTGLATFWSRKNQGLWVKGETSGNYLKVRAVYADCDMDSLVYDVEPLGPTCHNGEQSCFQRPNPNIEIKEDIL